MNSYFCKNPPCIHIVRDSRRKIYAVFLEVDEENIFELDPDVFESTCRALERVKSRGFRRASSQEVDFLAIKYLNARPAD